MMLEWLGERERALRIEEAVLWSLDQGLTKPTSGGDSKTRDVTEAMAKHLKRLACCTEADLENAGMD
jgi:isocitrate/isopropylmalate dehydrogenase